jgi:hypothetical protein
MVTMVVVMKIKLLKSTTADEKMALFWLLLLLL